MTDSTLPMVGLSLSQSQNITRVLLEGLAEPEIRKLKPVETPIKHYFSEGVYAREMTIPAGTIISGKIHKYRSIIILSKGDASLLTEDGVKRVRAPFTVVSLPGTKRLVYAHEECVFTTIHGTELTDLAAIESHFLAQSNEEYLAFERSQFIDNQHGEVPALEEVQQEV